MQFLRIILLALSLFGYCHGELVTLSIDNSAPNGSSVDILVDAGLLGDDQVTSSISGEVTLDLLPSAINPTSARIVNFNATVDDEVDFSVGFFLTRVTVEADPGTIKLSMAEPGMAGEIVDARFSQFESLVEFDGVITASVEPDPIDLSEQAPTPVNFEDVGLALDRSTATLNSNLIAEQIIPFDVGLLELEVVLDIEGSLTASGAIPPATYSISPPADTVTPFAETQNWVRGGVADTDSLPISIDSVVFNGTEENTGMIDLGGVQAVASVSTNGRVELQNGTLDIAGSLTVEEDAVLFLHSDAILQSSSMELKEDSFVIMSATTTHQVEGELAFDAQLSVFPPSETGSFDLFTFGQLTGSYSGVPPTHSEDGRFASIEIGDNAIRLVNTQAIVGDTDGNGRVEFADFLQLSSAFGLTGDWLRGDFDGNGIIEFADFLGLSANFGQSAEQALSEAATQGLSAVPEPTGRTLATMCFLFLFELRKRRSLIRRQIR